jgi:hypothetical protein
VFLHLIAMSNALDGHAMVERSHLRSNKKSTGARKKKKWWRCRNKGLVNS